MRKHWIRLKRIDARASVGIRITEMSRISNRIATISAVLGIILLVILLVILWSNVRNVDRIGDVGRTRNNSTVERIVDKARERLIDSAIDRITTTLDSIEQNFTNKGESYFYFRLFIIHSITSIKTDSIWNLFSNFKHAKIYTRVKSVISEMYPLDSNVYSN